MKRLTAESWKDLSRDDCCQMAADCAFRCFDEACPRGTICLLPRLYAKLAAYEDTGLQPEQIDPRFVRPLKAKVRRAKK